MIDNVLESSTAQTDDGDDITTDQSEPVSHELIVLIDINYHDHVSPESDPDVIHKLRSNACKSCDNVRLTPTLNHRDMYNLYLH